MPERSNILPTETDDGVAFPFGWNESAQPSKGKPTQSARPQLVHSRDFVVQQPEPAVTWKSYDHIAAGTYPAFCQSARIQRDPVFKRWGCTVVFDVLSDSLLDRIAQLYWFLNLGDGEKPHAGRRGKFWSAWVLANGHPPKRVDRLSARVFVRRHATVVVVDVMKNHEGIALSEPSYSKIQRVISWDTGAAR